ncbi:MAG: hypothetical protein IJV05_01040 [Muribaculaceae bacterium]|nr:hypothetical protein [Muribaculaceae bacterium]
MNPRVANKYFKRVWDEVSRLSTRTGYCRCYHLVDYLSALVRHGAHIEQYTDGGFWRYSGPQRSKCLTHFRRLALEKKYNAPADVHYFKNKPEFNRFFQDYVHRGWLWVKEATFEDFKAFLERHGRVIVKPMDGKQGDGIRTMDYMPGDDEALRRTFAALVEENVIVEELIVQHPGMVFGNRSVNTIRVLTACRRDGKARIMKAFLRAGVGDTLVDNTATGGYYYEVDLATGIVCSGGTSKDGDLVFIHPQTDIVMLGFKVPLWDEVVKMCIAAAQRLPHVALVGWDVAISQDHVQLVEGNNSADYIGYEFVGSNGYYEKIRAYMES